MVRRPGKPLEQDYVYIYRARSADEPVFETNDYVTLSRRWALGHAEHQAVVTGEPQIVIRAFVKGALVAEAYNPGEYFYTGPRLGGRISATVEAPNAG